MTLHALTEATLTLTAVGLVIGTVRTLLAAWDALLD